MYEPPSVPRPETVNQSDWYCLDCGESRISRESVALHWKSVHGNPGDASEKASPGIDIAQGSQLLQFQIRRDQWIEQQAQRLAAEMHEGFTPEDFVAEAEIREARNA